MCYCTIFRRVYAVISIIIIIFVLSVKVVGCHRIRLCHENIKCLENQKIRIDRLVNSSNLRELDLLQTECNRRIVCTPEEVRCEHETYSGMMLEYSCIKDLPRYDGSYPLKSGTLLSPNYPNPITPEEFRMRLDFRKNVTLTLTIHDIGNLTKKLYMDMYCYYGTEWKKCNNACVTIKSKKTFTNASIFDITLYAKRVWITFTSEEKRPVKIRHGPNNIQPTHDSLPEQTTPPKPAQKSQTWIIYMVVISVLSTIILIAAIAFIWKRCSLFGKCIFVRPQKLQEQRPDILTHFPSSGNIITGDILAQEFEAAAAEAEGNRNAITVDVAEDAISHYETIAVPHYTDFPKRPRPSLPDLPTCPRLASYIEVLPR